VRHKLSDGIRRTFIDPSAWPDWRQQSCVEEGIVPAWRSAILAFYSIGERREAFDPAGPMHSMTSAASAEYKVVLLMLPPMLRPKDVDQPYITRPRPPLPRRQPEKSGCAGPIIAQEACKQTRARIALPSTAKLAITDWIGRAN